MVKLLRPAAEGGQDSRVALKRTVAGTAAALATMAVLTAAMLPLRGSLSIATTALILVVPVVIGVVVGGFLAGVLSVIAGFLVYDFFFIPPIYTLWVGKADVSARPSTCGPIRTPPIRKMTICGMRGPGSRATTSGASAATSATATRSVSPWLRFTMVGQPGATKGIRHLPDGDEPGDHPCTLI
jgi:hypothetical protein